MSIATTTATIQTPVGDMDALTLQGHLASMVLAKKHLVPIDTATALLRILIAALLPACLFWLFRSRWVIGCVSIFLCGAFVLAGILLMQNGQLLPVIYLLSALLSALLASLGYVHLMTKPLFSRLLESEVVPMEESTEA